MSVDYADLNRSEDEGCTTHVHRSVWTNRSEPVRCMCGRTVVYVSVDGAVRFDLYLKSKLNKRDQEKYK